MCPSGTTVDARSAAERHRVANTFSQSHLLQMADAGIIEHDPGHGQVTTMPRLEAFESHLETDGDQERTVSSWL